MLGEGFPIHRRWLAGENELCDPRTAVWGTRDAFPLPFGPLAPSPAIPGPKSSNSLGLSQKMEVGVISKPSQKVPVARCFHML